jgi:hypothetical protein
LAMESQVIPDLERQRKPPVFNPVPIKMDIREMTEDQRAQERANRVREAEQRTYPRHFRKGA